MRRIKIKLAVWLPLLWLAAAADSSADVPGGGTSCCYRTSVSAAAGHGRHDSSTDFYPAKQALRNLNRRARTSGDPDPLSSSFFAAGAQLPGLRPAPVLFSVIEAPADLLRCWQFYSRTAPPQRAPSAVS